MRQWKLGEVCEHGSLGRQCEICERDEEIAKLGAALHASAETCDRIMHEHNALAELLDERDAEIEGLRAEVYSLQSTANALSGALDLLRAERNEVTP